MTRACSLHPHGASAAGREAGSRGAGGGGGGGGGEPRPTLRPGHPGLAHILPSDFLGFCPAPRAADGRTESREGAPSGSRLPQIHPGPPSSSSSSRRDCVGTTETPQGGVPSASVSQAPGSNPPDSDTTSLGCDSSRQRRVTPESPQSVVTAGEVGGASGGRVGGVGGGARAGDQLLRHTPGPEPSELQLWDRLQMSQTLKTKKKKKNKIGGR